MALCLAALSAFGQNSGRDNNDKTRYSSIIDMIRGLPGVQVGPDKGSSMPDIFIRGVGTNSNQYQPLFLVDYIRVDNILYLNPEDVDHVEVLKDGTASFYGGEGANGVIMIVTKEFVRQQKEAEQKAKEAKALAKQAKKQAKEARKAAKNAGK